MAAGATGNEEREDNSTDSTHSWATKNHIHTDHSPAFSNDTTGSSSAGNPGRAFKTMDSILSAPLMDPTLLAGDDSEAEAADAAAT